MGMWVEFSEDLRGNGARMNGAVLVKTCIVHGAFHNETMKSLSTKDFNEL